MEMYRCGGCGYVHVGPAPDMCPVCGAPRSLFLPYQRPDDLAGTRTLENLQAAFAGESQANLRYTLSGTVARLQGNEMAAQAFARAAAEETAHALGLLAYLEAVGDTPENLQAAYDGEDYEATSMYPEFSRVAEEEGFPDIARYFKALGGFERRHREAFKEAADPHA